MPGTGSTSAGLVFSGYTTTAVAITEDWNGNNFTEVADLNTSRFGGGAAGTTTAGLAFGGATPSVVASTEEWNSTSVTTKVLTD